MKKTSIHIAVLAGLVSVVPAWAVDLVGVHDLAYKNDPQLQAADFRREAVAENKRQAWSALLPTLSGSAGLDQGDTDSNIRATDATPEVRRETDIDTESWRLDFRQALYD